KIKDAQLSESEKQAKRLADLQAKEATWAAEKQRMILERAVEREAAALFHDPEDAMHYLDTAELEYDDAGRPKNLGKVLKTLAADLKERGKGYLLKSEQTTQPTPQSRASIGASNPSRVAASGKAELSWEYITGLSRAQFDALNADGSLSKWMKDHP